MKATLPLRKREGVVSNLIRKSEDVPNKFLSESYGNGFQTGIFVPVWNPFFFWLEVILKIC
jgi:hypothetical protein